MPDPDDFNFNTGGAGEWDWDYSNPADATNVVGGVDVAPTIDTDVKLTKGRYRFVFSKPVEFVNIDEPMQELVSSYDESLGYAVAKRISIDKITVDFDNDECYVDVTVIDNPIWIPIVYGAVFLVCVSIGALSTNSVLKRVETLLSSPSTNFLMILLFVVFGLPIIIPLLTKQK